jgi:SOS-response transcriptional repressor LexA
MFHHWNPTHKQLLEEVIVPYIERNGYSPTRRELATAKGQSTSSINQTLLRMRDRGLIRLHPGWRGIEVLPKVLKAVQSAKTAA